MHAPCFRLLDLPDDADERTIKRAYAAKLKTARPDEDPEGFQQLHDAYREALGIAAARASRARQSGDRDDGALADAAHDATRSPPHAERNAPVASREMPTQAQVRERLAQQPQEQARGQLERAPEGQPEAPPERAHVETFDPEAFYDRLLALLAYSRAGELQGWLDAQPVLWSLADKARLAGWLVYRMHERQPPVAKARFDDFAAYFGLDDLHSGYDMLALQRLRDRLHLVWMLQTDQLREIAERTRDHTAPLQAAMRESRRMLRQLKRPFSWPQALLAAMRPGFASAMRRFLHRLDHGNLDDLPPPIRQDQVAFWTTASDDTRISKPRLAVGAVGCFTLGAALALLSLPIPPQPGDTLVDASMPPWLRATIVFATVAGAALCMFLAMLAGQALRNRTRMGSDRTRHVVRIALVPVLSLGALLLASFTTADVLTLVAAFGALAIGVIQSPLPRALARYVPPRLVGIAGRMLLVGGVLVPLMLDLEPVRMTLPYIVPALALWLHAHAPLRRNRGEAPR